MTRAWWSMLTVLAGCSSCVSGAPSPAVVAGTDLGVCILDQYATTTACRPQGGNWLTCVETIAAHCGSDAASVVKVITAQRKAMVADGFVIPTDDGAP